MIPLLWIAYFDIIDNYIEKEFTMKIESANGKEGCLIYCGDCKYRIRFYDDMKMGMFKDYDIAHCDLFFTVNDEDAYLYEHEDGKMYLDHSPETLGIKRE